MIVRPIRRSKYVLLNRNYKLVEKGEMKNLPQKLHIILIAEEPPGCYDLEVVATASVEILSVGF